MGDAEVVSGVDIETVLAEPCDLSRAEKLRILVAHRDVKERTHWDVLGLRGEVNDADIKKAYFAQSKQFHPDRYYGRNLGSFAARLKDVFEGVKRAYEVLGDAKSRADYQRQHPPPSGHVQPLPSVHPRFRKANGDGDASGSGAPPPADAATRARLEERRRQILEERRQRAQKPIEDKVARAEELYEKALEQLRSGALVAAAQTLKLAVAYAPHRADYQARCEEVNQQAVQSQVKELVEQAEIEAATAQWFNAARIYARASDLQPSSTSLALQAAQAYRSAGDAQESRRFAERALKNSSRRKEVRVLLAELLEEAGEYAAALAHLEIAASLDRTDSHVKTAIKRLAKRVGS